MGNKVAPALEDGETMIAEPQSPRGVWFCKDFNVKKFLWGQCFLTNKRIGFQRLHLDKIHDRVSVNVPLSSIQGIEKGFRSGPMMKDDPAYFNVKAVMEAGTFNINIKFRNADACDGIYNAIVPLISH